MSNRSGRRSSPSVYSAMSSTAQRRMAAAEAEEAITKMEMEINLVIDKKKEELAEWEKQKRRALRNLNQYEMVDKNALEENDRISYQNYKMECEEAQQEAGAVEEEIRRLQLALERRKCEITKTMNATINKIDAIEEECQSEESEVKSVISMKVDTRQVDEWVNRLPSVPIRTGRTESLPSVCSSEPPPQSQAGWKRFELKDGVIHKTEAIPPVTGQNTDPPASKKPENQCCSEYQYSPPPHSVHGRNNENYDSYWNPPEVEPAPPPHPVLPAQPQDVVGQLAAALTQAFGTRQSVGGSREVVVKTHIDKDLPHFQGNPGEFCNFKAAYLRSTLKYKFDGDENMARLHKALKGDARKKVAHLMANPLNLPKLMETLEDCFGRPEYVLDFLVEKAKMCDKVELHKPESLVAFGDAVEALITNVCSYNKKDYLYNKQLTKELVDKLPGALRTKWFEWRADDDARETNLEHFSNWLKMRVKAARLQITPKMKVEEDEKTPRNQSFKRGPTTLVADDASSEEDGPEESGDDVDPTWTQEEEIGRSDDQFGGRKCWKVGWE